MSFTAKTGELYSYKYARPLHFPLYIARNFGLAVIGETAARYFNLVQSSPFGPDKRDFLSASRTLRKIDYFQILPGAHAASATNNLVNENDTDQTANSPGPKTSQRALNPQKRPETKDLAHPAKSNNDSQGISLEPSDAQSLKESDNAASADAKVGQTDLTPAESTASENGAREAQKVSEGVFAKLSGSFDSVKGRVTNLQNTVTGYISENQEWLAVAGSIVAVYSTFNWLTANKIQNAYARNLASMVTGVGVTWLGAYALGYKPDFNLVADLGMRIMGYHGLAQALQKPAYWTLGQGARVVSILGKPMAFPTQVAKAK